MQEGGGTAGSWLGGCPCVADLGECQGQRPRGHGAPSPRRSSVPSGGEGAGGAGGPAGMEEAAAPGAPWMSGHCRRLSLCGGWKGRGPSRRAVERGPLWIPQYHQEGIGRTDAVLFAHGVERHLDRGNVCALFALDLPVKALEYHDNVAHDPLYLGRLKRHALNQQRHEEGGQRVGDDVLTGCFLPYLSSTSATRSRSRAMVSSDAVSIVRILR